MFIKITNIHIFDHLSEILYKIFLLNYIFGISILNNYLNKYTFENHVYLSFNMNKFEKYHNYCK